MIKILSLKSDMDLTVVVIFQLLQSSRTAWTNWVHRAQAHRAGETINLKEYTSSFSCDRFAH